MCRWKLITFDVTNTLLKVQGTAGQQYSKAAKKLGISIPAADLDASYKRVWPVQWKVHPNYGSTTGLSQKQWWRQFVSSVFLDARYDGDMQTLHTIASRLYQDFEEGNLWDVMPGTHDMLNALQEHGIELGVVSNFDERLANTLERYKLKDYFSFLVTSVQCGFDKPDPRIFHAALDIAQLSPREVAHVGDDVRNDYLAARRVGMDAFLLSNGVCVPKNVPSDDVITELADLADIVDKEVKKVTG